jgi:hypothetical protein
MTFTAGPAEVTGLDQSIAYAQHLAEFGLYVSCGRVVLGAPPDCPNPERNRYLAWTARRFGVPVYPTLAETVAGALGLITGNHTDIHLGA